MTRTHVNFGLLILVSVMILAAPALLGEVNHESDAQGDALVEPMAPQTPPADREAEPATSITNLQSAEGGAYDFTSPQGREICGATDETARTHFDNSDVLRAQYCACKPDCTGHPDCPPFCYCSCTLATNCECRITGPCW